MTRLRDEFSVIYQDEDFGGLYPGQGQSALAHGGWPWLLTEFRARLVAGNAEQLLLNRMLERFRTRGLVKARRLAVPDWLRAVAPPAWFERYTRHIEEYCLPRG